MLILPSVKTVITVVAIVGAFALSQKKLSKLAETRKGSWVVAALGIIGIIAIALA